MRKAKDTQILAKASGNDVMRREAQKRINLLQSKYKQFSDATGLPYKANSASVSGYHRVSEVPKVLTNNTENSIIKSRDNIKFDTTKIHNYKSTVADESKDFSNIGSNRFSEEAKNQLYNDERIISRNKHETALLYDAFGNQVLIVVGNENDVIFTPQQIKSMRGCILTHNHPNSSVFSPEEINMLRRGRLAEIRACNSQGAYVLRSSGSWNAKISNFKKIKEAYKECMCEVGRIYADKAAQESKSIGYYMDEMDEETLKLFSKKYGLEFMWEDNNES